MTIDLVLAALLVIQNVYFMRQIQRLIDKLMSRSYYDFKQSENLPKPVDGVRMVLPDESDNEDLGTLTGIL